jgi:hypothetical protein
MLGALLATQEQRRSTFPIQPYGVQKDSLNALSGALWYMDKYAFIFMTDHG